MQGFSTGQRKRVALGRALLHDPDVLFLDEPTSGLDPEATRDVIDLIGSLATEHGRTVVLCTHFLGEAGRLAHRMAVLDQGRLLAFGTPAELAGSIWKGLDVGLDLGAAADETLIATLVDAKGVLAARVDRHRGARHGHRPLGDPPVVASLTSREIPVFGAVPMPPTLEDVYFAVVHDKAANEQAVNGRMRSERRGPAMSARIDTNAIRAVMWKDLTAVKRSKAVVLPMLLVPLLLFVMLPARSASRLAPSQEVNVDGFLGRLPGNVAAPIRELPEREQLVVLVNGYLLAPLFLIVPLMVSVVLAADAFAGEKERKTIEGLLHLPISDRDLFLAKLLGAFIPAVVVSWVGFLCFALVTNTDRVAGDAPRLRPDAAVGRDDPVGGAGSRRARPRRDGPGVGAGPHVTGSEPARRCGDPPADLHRPRAGDRLAPRRSPRRAHRRRGAVVGRRVARPRGHHKVQPGSNSSARLTRQHEELQHAREQDQREERGKGDGGRGPHLTNAIGVPARPSSGPPG